MLKMSMLMGLPTRKETGQSFFHCFNQEHPATTQTKRLPFQRHRHKDPQTEQKQGSSNDVFHKVINPCRQVQTEENRYQPDPKDNQTMTKRIHTSIANGLPGT